MNSPHMPTSRGSVYIVTLITVAAIASMVLIGINLRSTTSSTSTLIEQMAESNNSIHNAAEYALQTIASDPAWNATAQTGTVFSNFSIADTTYAATVTDADTASLPTDITTNYRLKLTNTSNTVTNTAQIDILVGSTDYSGILNDLGAIHYWPLNETDFPARADDSLGSAHGVYQDPAFAGISTNDEGGKVPVFNDSNDFVEIPWVNTLSTRAGSISLWVNCTGDNSTTNFAILGMDYTIDGNPSINLSMYSYGLTAYLDDDDSYSISNFAFTHLDIVQADTWFHVVVTWGEDALKIYIDGVLKGDSYVNRDHLSWEKAKWGGEQPMYIGGGFDTRSSATPEIGFVGSVAHVAFFGAQLDVAQIDELAAIKPDLSSFEIVPDSWAKVFE